MSGGLLRLWERSAALGDWLFRHLGEMWRLRWHCNVRPVLVLHFPLRRRGRYDLLFLRFWLLGGLGHLVLLSFDRVLWCLCLLRSLGRLNEWLVGLGLPRETVAGDELAAQPVEEVVDVKILRLLLLPDLAALQRIEGRVELNALASVLLRALPLLHARLRELWLFAVAMQRLTDPAKGTECRHLARCNYDTLRSYAGRIVAGSPMCPITGCQALLRRTRDVVRDEPFARQLREVPRSKTEVWWYNGELRLTATPKVLTSIADVPIDLVGEQTQLPDEGRRLRKRCAAPADTCTQRARSNQKVKTATAVSPPQHKWTEPVVIKLE